MRKAIFFDRDGTLLVEMGYVCHESLVVPYRFTPEALSLAREAGFLSVVVTNQSGIARGYLREEDLRAIHGRMYSMLAAEGAAVDAVYYCPHHPDGAVERYAVRCDCRKPATGMARAAIEEHGIDAARSYVVGDKVTDFLMGRNLGATSCLVRTGYGKAESRLLADMGLDGARVFDNVLEAVRHIVAGDPARDGEGH